jgi:hypothetical protein
MSWLSYLLDLELLLSFRIAARAGFGVLQLRRIGHLDVGHGCEVCGVLLGCWAILWCFSRVLSSARSGR